MAASRPAARARGLTVAAAVVVAAVAVTACARGDGPSGEERAQGSPPPSAQGVPSPYVPPPGTPLQGTARPDPARVRVIRRWVRELREGDIGAAARTFADGALVQNGTPVLRLGSDAERRRFMDEGFPCGAYVADASGARRDFTIVRFTLTQRVGGSCPGPGGGSAAAAIRVQGGRITEWYRLPDPGSRPPEPPDAAPPPPEPAPPV